MPVSAEGRVENQKRTQTATTLWPFGFVFCVQLGSLGKKTRRGPVRLVHMVKKFTTITAILAKFIYVIVYQGEAGAHLLFIYKTV